MASKYTKTDLIEVVEDALNDEGVFGDTGRVARHVVNMLANEGIFEERVVDLDGE